MDRQAMGRWGEQVAAEFLTASGYQVLDRNWRCRYGEIDLVVRKGGLVCFVEVKARSSRDFGEPAEAVRGRKIQRQPTLAALWVRDHRPWDWADLRYDVVSVVGRPGRTPEVEHLEGVEPR